MTNGEAQDAKPTALVIDDELLVRRTVARVFTRLGYQVFEAGSLADTLDMFRNDNFDVVCCDGNLPDGNGDAVYDCVESFLKSSEPKRTMPAWFFLSGGNCNFESLRRRGLLLLKPINSAQMELVLRLVRGDENLEYVVEAAVERDRVLRRR